MQDSAAQNMDSDEEFSKALDSFRATSLRRVSGAVGAVGKKADEYRSRDVMAPLRVPIYVFGSGLVASGVYLAVHGLWLLACFPALLVLGILVFYARVYWYWMKRDPDRLQTESYRIDSQLLGIVAEKGLPTQVAVALSNEEGETDEAEPPPMLAGKKTKPRILDSKSQSSEPSAEPFEQKTKVTKVKVKKVDGEKK